MKRKLPDAIEDAIAKDLEARRNLTLKRLLAKYAKYGVRNKITLYRGAKRSKVRRECNVLVTSAG